MSNGRIWGVRRSLEEGGILGLGSNGTSMNTYDGPYPQGVPNPFGVRFHAYPTRYHGPIYTRPMFSLPWMDRPYDFGVERGTAGLGQETTPTPIPAAPEEVMPMVGGETVTPEWAAERTALMEAQREPRTAVECNAMFPVADEVTDADSFAAYIQNEACHERVKGAKDSKRWLIGLGIAFIGGFVIGSRR